MGYRSGGARCSLSLLVELAKALDARGLEHGSVARKGQQLSLYPRVSSPDL
jgi:hypothetical protein